jgi:hypothetical protein
MFQTKFVGKIKTHFMFKNAVYEIMWKKCCTAEQATDDSMAQAQCMLDN